MAHISDTGNTPGPEQDRAHSLERWSNYVWHDGFQIPDLAPLERLMVRTCNHLYEVIVIEPLRALVMIRGGQYFPEFTRARINGSSTGGGFLKVHGIYAGFRLELNTDEQAIITSPVREVARVADLIPA
jgi:hypothetical protein